MLSFLKRTQIAEEDIIELSQAEDPILFWFDSNSRSRGRKQARVPALKEGQFGPTLQVSKYKDMPKEDQKQVLEFYYQVKKFCLDKLPEGLDLEQPAGDNQELQDYQDINRQYLKAQKHFKP